LAVALEHRVGVALLSAGGEGRANRGKGQYRPCNPLSHVSDHDVPPGASKPCSGLNRRVEPRPAYQIPLEAKYSRCGALTSEGVHTSALRSPLSAAHIPGMANSPDLAAAAEAGARSGPTRAKAAREDVHPMSRLGHSLPRRRSDSAAKIKTSLVAKQDVGW